MFQFSVDSLPYGSMCPNGTCSPMYQNREYLKAKVYTIWVHGPLNPEPLKEPLGEPMGYRGPYCGEAETPGGVADNVP